MGVLIGIFIVMLCITPAMAAKPLDTEEGVVAGEMNTATVGTFEQTTNPGGISRTMGDTYRIDTQTPVLDGSAFTNYDTLFIHGTMAKANPSSFGVNFEGDYSDGHSINLNPSVYNVYVSCPFVSYHSKQGGIQPRARYLGLEYKTSETAEITGVWIFNGHNSLGYISFNPPLKSTAGFTTRVIDLEGWHLFDRGLNMVLGIRNPSSTSYGNVMIGGYGARFEW